MELLARPLDELCADARALRDEGHGRLVTYSPKVFIPLTKLCRDVCHYCTFAHPPRRGERAYMSIEEVLDGRPRRRGRRLPRSAVHSRATSRSCATALRAKSSKRSVVKRRSTTWPARRRPFSARPGSCRISTPACMTREDAARLRRVSASMGLMLETTSDRLSARGGPHFGSPDKVPARRLETLAAAGEERVPFTTGLLIGIGESRAERIDALLAIRELARALRARAGGDRPELPGEAGDAHGRAPEPALEELLWTIAVARILLGPRAHLQAPPNLSYDDFPRLLDAGIDDWGGVSPVTIDHVNPEAPWPELDRLRTATESRGLELAPRLPVYPEWISGEWIDPGVMPAVSARVRFAGARARRRLVAGRRRLDPVRPA